MASPDCDIFILCGDAIPERGLAVANRFLVLMSDQITGCESDTRAIRGTFVFLVLGSFE